MKSVLAYRDNRVWSVLKADLCELATRLQVEAVQVFPEGTSEEEMSQWLQASLDSDARHVIADGTTSRLVRTWHLYTLLKLDDVLGHAVEASLKGKPWEFYTQAFLRLAEIGIERVKIVVENISDYNPLKIDGYDGYNYSREKSVLYAEEFAKLLPCSVKVDLISMDELSSPDDKTVVLCHHHAFNQCKPEVREFRRHSRVLEPYVTGFFMGVSVFCDLSNLVTGDIIEETRRALKEF